MKKVKIILSILAIIFPILAVGQEAQAETCNWVTRTSVISNLSNVPDIGGCTPEELKSCTNQCSAGAKPASAIKNGVMTEYICCPYAASELPPQKPYQSLNFTPQITIPNSAFSQGNIPVGTYNASTQKVTTDLLAKYVKVIYNYGFSIAAILAALVLMGGGVLWLVSGGDSSKVTQAKDLITGSIVGLIILSCSWIILNTINPSLLNFQVLETTLIKKTTDTEPVSTIGNPTNSTSCSGCVQITSIPCKDGSLADANLVNKLNQAKQNSANLDWQVTEAYPPKSGSQHSSACHYNGMCVDVAISPSTNVPCAKVDQLISVLTSAGLSVLNEYTDCGGVQTTYATGNGHLHVQ